MAKKSNGRAKPTKPTTKSADGTKLGKVLAMLQRRQGATAAQIKEVLSYPHSSMRSLRKRGHAITSTKGAEGSKATYRLA
jgi:Protein of unknown function (DUF3489)